MRPGVANGVPYDGRMTQIQGNHVALVETGRAGSDVVVGDNAIQPQPKELNLMSATALPRSGLVAAIALGTYLRPKLAKDTKIDFGPVLAGKTGKAWATSKSEIKLGLDAAVKDKLAKDADISDVDWVLNQLDDVVGDEDPMPSNALDEDDDDKERRLRTRTTTTKRKPRTRRKTTRTTKAKRKRRRLKRPRIRRLRTSPRRTSQPRTNRQRTAL